MKYIFLILLFFQCLFSKELVLELPSYYSYNNYPYILFLENKENKIIEEIGFILKFDFKYKYIKTNNLSFQEPTYFEKPIEEPYKFQLTGIYFAFKNKF